MLNLLHPTSSDLLCLFSFVSLLLFFIYLLLPYLCLTICYAILWHIFLFNGKFCTTNAFFIWAMSNYGRILSQNDIYARWSWDEKYFSCLLLMPFTKSILFQLYNFHFIIHSFCSWFFLLLFFNALNTTEIQDKSREKKYCSKCVKTKRWEQVCVLHSTNADEMIVENRNTSRRRKKTRRIFLSWDLMKWVKFRRNDCNGLGCTTIIIWHDCRISSLANEII